MAHHAFTSVRALFLSGLIFCSAVWAVDIGSYGLNLGLNVSSVAGADAEDMGVFFVDNEWARDGEFWAFAVDGEEPILGNLSMNSGVAVGFFMTLEFNDVFKIRGELNYTWRGASYAKTLTLNETYGDAERRDSLIGPEGPAAGMSLTEGSRKYDMSNAYLDIPLLFTVAPVEGFNIMAGPQLAIALHNSFTTHRSQTNQTFDDIDMPGNKSTEQEISLNLLDYGYVTGLSVEISDQFELGARYAQFFNPIIDNEMEPEITSWQMQLLASFNFSDW
jgi:hypothetical protein